MCCKFSIYCCTYFVSVSCFLGWDVGAGAWQFVPTSCIKYIYIYIYIFLHEGNIWEMESSTSYFSYKIYLFFPHMESVKVDALHPSVSLHSSLVHWTVVSVTE